MTAAALQSIDQRLAPIIREMVDAEIPLQQALSVIGAKYVIAALAAARGNITGASRKLGVHRNTLHLKLRMIGIETRSAEHRRKVRERRGQR